jgi:hypothetical protein
VITYAFPIRILCIDYFSSQLILFIIIFQARGEEENGRPEEDERAGKIRAFCFAHSREIKREKRGYGTSHLRFYSVKLIIVLFNFLFLISSVFIFVLLLIVFFCNLVKQAEAERIAQERRQAGQRAEFL